MRHPLLALLLPACAAPATPPDRDPDTTASVVAPNRVTGPRGTTTPTTTGETFRLEASGPVACADPDRRVGEHFLERLTPALPTTARHLWGAGAIVGDLTGDGWFDLVLVGEADHRAFAMRPSDDPELAEPIELAPEWLGSADLSFAVGGTTADLDGDGWLDLVIARWAAPNRLLRNLGGTGFEDVTPPAMEAVAARTQSATVGDVDGDGDLDLVFGNYAVDPDDAFIPDMPPAEPAEVYRNDGNGAWTDVSHLLPAEVHDGYTFATGLYDLDDDGLPELFVSNDFGTVRPSVLARNLGGFAFEPDLSWHPAVEDMGMGVGDLNGDEVPDFLITSWRRISLLLSGEAAGAPGVWFDGATSAGITVQHTSDTRRQDFGWGADLADLDNDGDLDALAVFGDWDTWTADEAELDAVWVQVDDAPLTFEERSDLPEWDLADPRDGRAVATADLNGDGWLDVVKANVNQVGSVRLSHCGTEAWLRVELADDGPNTRGIGATVVVEVDGARQVRWITAGSSGLYTGAPPEAHFGLGLADRVDRLEVRWPDGATTEFVDLEPRQRVRVVRDRPPTE